MSSPRPSAAPAGRSAAFAWLALVLLAALASLALLPPVRAAGRVQETETSALINQQLDSVVDLELRNRPLPEVLQQITNSAGVPFTVADETYALLPWGRETPISATAKNTPLRQTLEAITRTLGLSYVLRKEAVEIRPLPALRRMGRRATVQEIAGLDVLGRERLELLEERPTVAQVLEAVDLRLQQLDTEARGKNLPEPGFKVENRLDDPMRGQPVFVRRNATLMQALEALVDQTKATWYAWGDSFIVVPKETWVRQQLDLPVELVYNQVEVQQALQELERISGVPFTIEPGALQRIPSEFRRIRLSLIDTTVRSALEGIAGLTGLTYEVTDQGVYFQHAESAARPATGAAGDNAAGGEGRLRPVLLVPLEDGSSLMLFPSDLPPDVLERLESRRQQAIERLRAQLPARPSEPAN